MDQVIVLLMECHEEAVALDMENRMALVMLLMLGSIILIKTRYSKAFPRLMTKGTALDSPELMTGLGSGTGHSKDRAAIFRLLEINKQQLTLI